jgi:oligopeptide/dipeptide ABC transporter ATP-binding protein
MIPDTFHQPLLKVTNLKKHFPVRRGFLQRVSGWVKAVDGVDLTIESGKTLGLVGESGCGKSTVAKLILKLISPDSGDILFEGENLSPLSEARMKPFRRKLQIVFQDPYGSLNPRMTIGQSISEGLARSEFPDPLDQSKRLAQLLEMVGMSPDSADRYPHEFSGGQRQRIGIARALSVNPSLIVCDEPISALDVSIQAQIINLLKDLQDELGVSYLFISHDLNVVGYLCHAVSVMYRGQIMEHAPSDVLFGNPCHPYTRTLLAAGFDLSGLNERPDKLEKESDGASIDFPGGCPYGIICKETTEDCLQTTIPLTQIEAGHFVRCLKYSDPDGTVDRGIL